MCKLEKMGTFLRWIGTFIGWLSNMTHSYMLALFLFAIIVEVLLLPLSIKQQKNSIKQAKLRPKEMAIKKKYAGRNDQVTTKKMQEEIQALHTRENFSPLAGCLPLLIQLPIIIILYSVIRQPLEYVVGLSSTTIDAITEIIKNNATYASLLNNNGTIGHITAINQMGLDAFSGLAPDSFAELSAAVTKGLPNFTELGMNLGMVPSITAPSLLLLIPLFTFIVYFGSMKLTRKFTYQPVMSENQAMGCSNNIMDIGMPLFSVYISFQFPAAIGVYWVFKSVISTIKQFVLYKIMPVPKCSEEDIKAAEKELKGKSGKNSSDKDDDSTVAKLPSGQKPRSLHYIDSDENDGEAEVVPDTHKGTRFDYDDDNSTTEKSDETSESKPKVERAELKEDNVDDALSGHKKKFEKKNKKNK